VKNPGVYAFCGNQPRAEEVIRRAGGVRMSRISFDLLGSATAVTSGKKVIVRLDGTKYRIYTGEMNAHYKVSLSIPLSVNRESLEGLTAVPGIGFKLAGAIVRARDSRGGFKTLDELALVPGIGKVLYGKIKPYLTL
jgi:competence protein ComEA